MSCRRVKQSVPPSRSAASVTTIRSRAGTWIRGSSASAPMAMMASPTPRFGQSSRAAAMAAPNAPRTIGGAVAG